MGEGAKVEVEFPERAIMALLSRAQHLFDSREKQRDLLSSLGLLRSAVQPQEVAAGPMDSDKVSSRGFARNLVRYLYDDTKFDVASTLVRRVGSELDLSPADEPVEEILKALDALYLAERARSMSEGQAPDLETYRQWVGFLSLHTYSLTDRFFGRSAQLETLDEWLARLDDSATVQCICALGGGGKTALAWHWISRAQNTIRQSGYRGVFWCSFYEKGFDFTEFLKQAVLFCTQATEEGLKNLTRGELESRLHKVLSEERFLLVIDGLERLMNGYATAFDRAVDAESIQVGKQLEEVTAYDRRLTDPRSGSFLRHLAGPLASKILITTRLEPAELQDAAAEHPLPSVSFMSLEGLDPESADQLWVSIVPDGVISKELRAVFVLSGYHPLVISILARSVARVGGERAWETWLELPEHQDFAPRKEKSETARRAHIIGICLGDLGAMEHDVLGVLTTSGKPMAFDVLTRLLIRGSATSGDERWQTGAQVTSALDRLLQLGFIGSADTDEGVEYDVHPVVRGAAWNLLTDPGRKRLLSSAMSEFYATPDRQASDSLEALNRATSYFKILAQTGEYDRAWEMYQKLWYPMTQQSANRELLELFELLLPERDALRLVPLRTRRQQAQAAELLGHLLMTAGDVSRSDRLLRWCGAIRLQLGDAEGFLNARHNRLWQTMYQGQLFRTEFDLRTMLIDAVNFRAVEIIPSIECWIGIVLAMRGEETRAREHFDRAKGDTESFRWWAQGVAEGYVYLDEPDRALEWIAEAEKTPLPESDARMQVAWERLTRGIARFQKREFDEALDDLSFVLERGLQASYMVVQRFSIPYIAEIYLEKGQLQEAETRVGDYFRIDPESEYQLSAADACRVKALCLLKRGETEEATRYAAKAYRLAACDGPPFVYAKGLQRAQTVLERCGAYLPRASSRLEPEWRLALARFSETERQSIDGADRDDAHPPREVVIISTVEEAQEVLERSALMREASKLDRQWWEEVTRHTHSMLKLPLADAMQRRGIKLDEFRRAYEDSEHKSFEVVFHQVYADRIISPSRPRTVRSLSDADRATWLADVASHQAALEHFLDTELAAQARIPFQMHEFESDTVGMSAFLADDRLRIGCDEKPDAMRWWDQLQNASEPMGMLVLAECILMTGNTLAGLFDAVAIGDRKGIEFAFARTLVDRAIERLRPTGVSRTEGWSAAQIFFRLEDVKQQLGWSVAVEDARRLWGKIEDENQRDIAKVLKLAEELSLLGASLDDYYQAYLYSNSDNIQANLAYVDYARLKDEPWPPDELWPEDDRASLAISGASSPTFTDASGWSAERIGNRLEALEERLQIADASDSARGWFRGLRQTMELTALLRFAEELEVRNASIQTIYLAHVDGATDNPRAALRYSDFSALKSADERRAESEAQHHNSAGNELYNAGRYLEAVKCYEDAIEASPKPGPDWFYTNLASAWKHVEGIDEAERYRNAMVALQRGVDDGVTSESLRKGQETLRERMRVFDRVGYPAGKLMLPVVTPIAMEVAANLIPLVESGESGQLAPGFAAQIEIMRKAVLERTGVAIPGLRVRGNEADMPDGSYLIMLDEVPVVMGTVSLDKAFARQTVDQLADLGVEGEEAVDPLDGKEAAWVPIESVDALDVESWGPAGYMIRHLEAVLMGDLASFSGHQEVTSRLRDDWSDAAQAILDDPAKVSLLVRLLRGLLDERVPTTAFSALCELMEQTAAGGRGLDELLVRARMLPDVRAMLQGNDPSVRLLTIAAQLQELLRNAISEQGDEHVLALGPEKTQEALSAVRTEVGGLPDGRRLALVVDDALLRRYVRLLVALEFPYLSVMSHAELVDGWQDRVIGNVDLE